MILLRQRSLSIPPSSSVVATAPCCTPLHRQRLSESGFLCLQVWRRLTVRSEALGGDNDTSSFCTWLKPRASAVLRLTLHAQDACTSALVIGLLANSLEEVGLVYDTNISYDRHTHEVQLLVDQLGFCLRLRQVSVRCSYLGIAFKLHRLSLVPSLRDLTFS